MILGASSVFTSDVDEHELLAELAENDRLKFGQLLDDGCRVFSPERFARFMRLLVAYRGGIQKAARLRQAFLADCTVLEGAGGNEAYLLGPGASHVVDLLAAELQRKGDKLAVQPDDAVAAAFAVAPAAVPAAPLHDAASAQEAEFLMRWQAVVDLTRSYMVDEWGVPATLRAISAASPELERLARCLELFRRRLLHAAHACRTLLDAAWGLGAPADAEQFAHIASAARADDASLTFADLLVNLIATCDEVAPKEGISCRNTIDPTWIAQAAYIGRALTDFLEAQHGHLCVASVVGSSWPVKPLAAEDVDALERAMLLAEELAPTDQASGRTPMLFGTHESKAMRGTAIVPPALLDDSGIVYACPMREHGAFYLRCRPASLHAACTAELIRRECVAATGEEALTTVEDQDLEAELDALLRTERVPVTLAALALGDGLMASVDFACGDELAVVGCGDFFEIWRAVDYQPEPLDPFNIYFEE